MLNTYYKVNCNKLIFIFSVSKDEFCAFCGNEDQPKTAVDAVWVRLNVCDKTSIDNLSENWSEIQRIKIK